MVGRYRSFEKRDVVSMMRKEKKNQNQKRVLVGRESRARAGKPELSIKIELTDILCGITGAR